MATVGLTVPFGVTCVRLLSYHCSSTLVRSRQEIPSGTQVFVGTCHCHSAFGDLAFAYPGYSSASVAHSSVTVAPASVGFAFVGAGVGADADPGTVSALAVPASVVLVVEMLDVQLVRTLGRVSLACGQAPLWAPRSARA